MTDIGFGRPSHRSNGSIGGSHDNSHHSSSNPNQYHSSHPHHDQSDDDNNNNNNSNLDETDSLHPSHLNTEVELDSKRARYLYTVDADYSPKKKAFPFLHRMPFSMFTKATTGELVNFTSGILNLILLGFVLLAVFSKDKSCAPYHSSFNGDAIDGPIPVQDDVPVTEPEETSVASAAGGFADDLSEKDFDPRDHEKTWFYCPITPPADGSPMLPPTSYCDTKPTNEQSWQIGWYGGQVAVGAQATREFPKGVDCVQLPPPDYQWPARYTEVPAKNQSFFHWPNLRVTKYEDLIIFNQGTPKNLYHFDAVRYDLDGLGELELAAKYIPFQTKIRNFLDIGAGGASLGLILKRKYQVETMSIIFPDWPYCEYISERGGLCVLVDVMEAMPFAGGTFDAVHISWVYHGQQPDELLEMYTEVHRVIRPGGYMWMRGGWSMRQINTLKHMLDKFGYVQLYDNVQLKPEGVTKSISFGPDLPFDAEWTCIYVKPMKAERKPDCPQAPALAAAQVDNGAPTQINSRKY